ncbi:MAG: flagellar motor switch protein FliM [Clostridia bacterium]|nr:flagellar motor switch protein FliM [Clostridia bacterium]
MADILSQEEIDSLLNALQTGAVDAEEMKEKESDKKISLYNFKRPNKFSKDQLKTLQFIHENFARLVSTMLSGKLRTRVSIKVASVEQLTYDEFIRSVPNPTIINIFQLDPLEGKSVLEFNPQLVFFIIDKLFGGPGVTNFKARPLTEIEEIVVSRFMKEMLDHLRESWENIIDVNPLFESLETNPTFSQIVSPTEMVILITLNIQLGEELEGFMNICIPCYSLEPIGNKLNAKFWYGSESKTQTEDIINTLNSKVKRTKMDVSAVLGETYITIKDLLEFRVGDVINLEKHVDDEIDIKVQKRKKFKGKLGLVGKSIGVQITRPIFDNDNAEEDEVI